ncbi:transposase [Streptomyces sp. NPDC090445]|uniref:transposase n=1 Tax=Streptomyces sp. NPDC090445 TaxID=3365963 RepID=UPI003823A691
MIRRHELSDAEWDLIRPLLPRPVMGRPRLDDRTVLNGIVWKFRTGVAWRDVPDRYGLWTTLHTRFRRWAADGTFDRMLTAAQAQADAADDIDWLVSIDSPPAARSSRACWWSPVRHTSSAARRPRSPGGGSR